MSMKYYETIEFVEKIGSGSYSNVYRTDKDYAVKVMTHDSVPSETTIKEIACLKRVKSPYIIPLLDVVLDKDCCKLVLPLAKYSLDKIIGHVSYDAKKVMRQLILALIEIHSKDILHLDIKPENILIRDSGDIWLADMGISEIHTNLYPIYDTFYYTSYYRPPELIRGERSKLSEKLDIWALGVVFAEMLLSRKNGKRMYVFGAASGGEPSCVLTDIRLRIEEEPMEYLKRLGVSEEEAAFLARILKINPETRPSLLDILIDPFLSTDEMTLDKLSLEDKILDSTYPSNKWGDLYIYRGELIEWLFEVKDEYRLLTRVLALGIYLLDRVMELKTLQRSEIQLYGVAALVIASELLPYNSFDSDEACYITDNAYSSERIADTIREILVLTDYDIAPITPYELMLINKVKGHVAIWNEKIVTEEYFRETK